MPEPVSQADVLRKANRRASLVQLEKIALLAPGSHVLNPGYSGLRRVKEVAREEADKLKGEQ